MADSGFPKKRVRKKIISSRGHAHASSNNESAAAARYVLIRQLDSCRDYADSSASTPTSTLPTTKRKKKLTTKRKARALTNPSIPIDDACRFLDLAAELHITIYEYVLLDKEPIVITKKTFRKPALLRTCKQIQNEASQVYYGPRNKFTFTSKYFDALALKHFCDASHGLWRANSPRIEMYLGWAGQNWSRLVRWLKWCYKREVPIYECKKDCTGRACCDAKAAFQVVELLPSTLDWDTVVFPVLEVHKRTTEHGRGSKWKA